MYQHNVLAGCVVDRICSFSCQPLSVTVVVGYLRKGWVMYDDMGCVNMIWVVFMD